jgi:anaerobic selenocysteine-containing dehydrogenase
MMCMQADDGTLVHVEDGIITNIVGNPDCPTNRGKICIRSISSIMGLYNPYRVKGPLKRTNPEKGPDIDPGWVEITWEEALNTVAEKFKKIREKTPRLLVWEGWGCAESLFITPKRGRRLRTTRCQDRSSQTPSGTPNVVGSTALSSPSIMRLTWSMARTPNTFPTFSIVIISSLPVEP